MDYLKLSDFFNIKCPFLLGAFYGFYRFSDDKKLIYTQSSYKSSKFVKDENFYAKSKKCYLEILNSQSQVKFWHKNSNKLIKRAEFVFILENDLNFNEEKFFKKLYSTILLSQSFWNKKENLKFIRAFFELRGSIDLKLNFLSFDYFYSNEFDLKRVRLLIDIFNIPFYIFNFNFRELQKEFIDDKNKRNTQLRVNLSWYVKIIGILNPYKAEITKTYFKDFSIKNKITYFNCELQTSNKKTTFLDRIDFYTSRIYNKDLVKFNIKDLRKELGFDDDDSKNFRRDLNIVNFFKFATVDECAACKEEYNIKDRSFLTRKDRYYTEIHHFISVGKNKNLDILENLTKLCPTCHRALSRGSANEEFQKKLVKNILNNNRQNFEFASLIFENSNENFLIQKIYENLK